MIHFLSTARKQALQILRPYIGAIRYRPVITDPFLGRTDLESQHTCLIVCGLNFDQERSSAAVFISIGFARGFQKLGIRTKLVSVFDLEREIQAACRPLVYLSIFHYEHLAGSVRKQLRRVPHFVWVTPWPEDLKRQLGIDWDIPPASVCRRILESEPRFVWAPVGSRGVSLYEGWDKREVSFVPLHLACDPERYFYEAGNTEFSGTKIAFVGTYQAVKASAFEQFLRPYEDQLVVYGTNSWPYCGYRGPLPVGKERLLYQNAQLSPAINAQICYDGLDEINERVFKVMGSRGLTIVDTVLGYRELFTEDELLMPDSIEEFHDLVRRALGDDDFNHRYSERGYRAIQERHTYAHRAQEILTKLGIEHHVSPFKV